MRASRARTRIYGTEKYGGFNSNGGRGSTHKRPRAQSLRTKPDRRNISIAETPQFPSVFRGPIDLSGRHLDADHCAILAHLPAYRLLGAPRIARLRGADTYPSVVADWRLGCRPVAPPARGNCHARSIDVAGVRAGGAHSHRTHTRVGNHRVGDAAGRGERVRCARKA